MRMLLASLLVATGTLSACAASPAGTAEEAVAAGDDSAAEHARDDDDARDDEHGRGHHDRLVERRMTEAGIVNDVIDVAPASREFVRFPSGKHARLGNELTPSEASSAPDIEWRAHRHALYTVAMVDPDAPSRANPTLREIAHWLVVNVPGDDVARGTVIEPFAGPQPPQGSGLHRYVLLVYTQPAQLDVAPLASRAKFDIRQFAHDHDLGNPVAGNFFEAQFQNAQ